MNITAIKRVYFLGIGGIGMSALAKYFKQNGAEVAGYDKTATTITDELINIGIPIHFDDSIDNIPFDPELVIYTPAIPVSHKEFLYFQSKKYLLKKRAEVLGLISEKYFTIAIAGTHGKTTTTSILAHIFKQSGIPILAFIGGISKNYQSNFVFDNNAKYMIVEADEYDRSFLSLYPYIAIITSMDADHLDIYENKTKVVESFQLFANQINDNGYLVIKKNLPYPVKFYNKKIVYSSSKGVDCYFDNLRNEYDCNTFDIICNEMIIENITMQIPGKHNIENAIAATSVAYLSGIKKDIIKQALQSYQGVKRRFDYIIKSKNLIFIDDYAHHPQEINAFLDSVKILYPNKKITVIFQPHLFTRTRDFADEFAKSLSKADEIFLLNIYPAREKPIIGVDSAMLLSKISLKDKHLVNKNELLEKVKNGNFEIILTVGAGDIDQLIEPLKQLLIGK